MKPVGRSLLTAVKGRSYVSQAALKPPVEQRAPLPKEGLQKTRLPNGIMVASIDNYAPVSRIGIFYNAGSRYEQPANMGITHCLRNLANTSTATASGFSITRSVQQIGASLSVTSTRENMIYSMECLRNNLDAGLECLKSVAIEPAFKPWEVKDSVYRHRLDLALLQEQPDLVLMEAIHQAAYRDNLGNSLYMPDYRIESHSREMLVNFVSKFYTSGNMCLAGVGVDHDEMVRFARSIALGTAPSSADTQKAQFSGDEVRVNANSEFSRVAIVSEGCSYGSSDQLALSVLQHIMGVTPHVSYGSNTATSRVSKAANQATDAPVAASCINANYSDSGLFGFQVLAYAADMDKVLRSVVGNFNDVTKGGITDADVARGKSQLLSSLSMGMENSGILMHHIGTVVSMDGPGASFDELQAAVDAIKTADVQNVAKKVIAGKPAMAAIGDLSDTPYLDQLL